MILDAIVLIIIILAMAHGYRHGFIQTFLHMIGWLAAVVLGFVCHPYITAFLRDKTPIYDRLYSAISNRLVENTAASSDAMTLDGLPEILQKAFKSTTDTVVVSVADGVASIVLNVIGFLIIIIAIKLLFLFITSSFSKKSHGGVIGGFDGFLGLIIGGIKGLIVVFILLALLVPITNLWGNTFLLDSLDNSLAARQLYDNNLLFLTVKDLI